MQSAIPHHLLKDPLVLKSVLWPNERFYRKQLEVVRSVQHDSETYVVAGNQLGKDYIAAFLVLWFALSHHPFKCVTTSAVAKHLTNLWGEMDRFIRKSRVPLTSDKGGPLIYNHFYLGKMMPNEQGILIEEKDSYAMALVATSENKGEGLAGHHAPHTLFVADEASGLPNVCYSMAQGWAKKMLVFGNPNNCSNFFREGVEKGDILSDG